MEIIIIVAMAENRVIGRDGAIPWHIPGEQRRFRDTTWGWPLIMGRKTFDSIGRPLPGRRNIVISRQAAYEAPGCEVAGSLGQALALCAGTAKVFVIGGEQIFTEALPLTDTVILSRVHTVADGDTFFPPFEDGFVIVSRDFVVDSVSYTIEVYRRKAG